MKTYSKLGDILSAAVGVTSEREIAQWCGVSQAAVSKWISGLTRPSPLYLVILASHLSLEPYKLAEAAGYDPEKIVQLFEDRWILSQDLDYARTTIKHIYDARIQGNSAIAIEIASDLNMWLQSFSTPSQELLKVRARVLFEQSWAYKEISFPEKIKQSTKQITTEINNLAEVYKDGEIYGLAGICKGDTFYILKKFMPAIRELTNVLQQNLVTSTDDKLWLLRALALSAGYLNDYNTVENAEIQVRTLIEDGKYSGLEHFCHALEGIGRAQGLLGLSTKSFSTLYEAEKMYRLMELENKKAPLRAVQVARSKLMVIHQLEPHNWQTIEQVGSEAIRIAQEYGYERHEQQIIELLNRALN